MPAINVFVAYIDTYAGQQLARQFEDSPQRFVLHGCTWSKPEADGDDRNAREQPFQVAGMPQDSFHQAQSEHSALSPRSNSRGSPDHPAQVTVATGAEEGEEQQQQRPMLMSSSRYFWRRDVPAVQQALLLCDWVIVEQRQAQEVFDILNFLQQGTFSKPKKMVLLSSFMTWFATPPLALPEAIDADDASGDEEEEEEESISAPYPPPPEDKSDADDLVSGDDGDGDDKDDAGGEEEGAGEEGDEVEVLTEDQYNRRVPHATYYNWRDAEKAVAAAHHAKGLPLDTYVVFAGLPYGEGESVLEPFFRQAWIDTREYGSSAVTTLPVYGTGKQRVPMIHVRDLATFTRKLLRCPADELPNPSARYFFATDGANLSWFSIITTVNRMFGSQRALVTVPRAEFPLHAHIEQFIVDLRVDSETVRAIMEREETAEDAEAITPRAGGSAWVAEGGLQRNRGSVALEFRATRGVTPLRIALVGPPMAGKTYMSAKIARHYRLPCFSVDDVVEQFKEALQHKQEQLDAYKDTLIRREQERRLAIKKRRILRAERRAAADDDNEGADDEGEGEDEGEDAAAGDGPHVVKPQKEKPLPDEDDVEEREEREFELTEAEAREAEEATTERYEASARVERLRGSIARMERVLLMRTRPPPVTPDANPKKRATLTKKKLTKEQQRRKEEDELQQVKESLKDAPLQDRAIALILQWRLSQPDCRNQGYVLDGFPTSVDLARLCFNSEELVAPQTEEEALNPPPVPSKFRSATAEGDDGEEAEETTTEELCDEWRMPNHVIVLEADENYLLDRLTACTRAPRSPSCAPPQQQLRMEDSAAVLAANSDSPTAPQVTPLDLFHECMATFTQEFVEAPYSALSYFECAVTSTGRRVETHLLNVEDEPLVPAPPPASINEVVPPGPIEAAICDCIGRPCNFGKTPLELHQEEVREQRLAEEQRQAVLSAQELERVREEAAFEQESAARSHAESNLAHLYSADCAALEERKAPLREYLTRNVVPLLSKGLIAVCAQRPENPVDFLSEWLLRHNPHDDVFCDL